MAKVKICGVQTDEIALYCVDSGVDLIGLNLSPKSKRQVDPDTALALGDRIKNYAARKGKPTELVLLFYQNSLDFSIRISEKIKPDRIQLLWEDKTLIQEIDQFRGIAKLLPAFPVTQNLNNSDIPFPPEEIPILDTPTDRGIGGGTGKKFPWERLQNITRPFFLAGGINPENIGEALKATNAYGIDVASGIESEPGVASKDKIHKLLSIAHEWEGKK
jgi:phosphoribosylanthranilate isomerase